MIRRAVAACSAGFAVTADASRPAAARIVVMGQRARGGCPAGMWLMQERGYLPPGIRGLRSTIIRGPDPARCREAGVVADATRQAAARIADSCTPRAAVQLSAIMRPPAAPTPRSSRASRRRVPALRTGVHVLCARATPPCPHIAARPGRRGRPFAVRRLRDQFVSGQESATGRCS